MCGRFVRQAAIKVLAEAFDAVIGAQEMEMPPSFNVAPSQPVACVVPGESGAGGREVSSLTWGLVPQWARSRPDPPSFINARSETAAEKPSFRDAYRTGRCLVLADGFYEWTGEAGARRPMLVRLPGAQPFAFAGLASGGTCTILTCAPNDAMHPIHDRMPVILEPVDLDAWLDPGNADPSTVLRPWPRKLDICEVSTRVNNPAYDAADCLDPVG